MSVPITNCSDPMGPVYTGRYGPENTAAKETITVVSYNIKFAEKITEAIDDLSGMSELRDADILLLQEMDHEGTESIASALRYNYVYYPTSIHKTGKDFGNAILSRWPIHSHRKIILPHERWVNKQRRIAVAGMIDMAGTDMIAYSVHTETIAISIWKSRKKRVSQVDAIVKSMPEAEEVEQVIVGGDFNSWTEGGSIKAMESLFATKGLERATKGIGATATSLRLLFLKFDHIFTRGMTVLDRGKVKQAKASDHKPIWVKLKINGSI